MSITIVSNSSRNDCSMLSIRGDAMTSPASALAPAVSTISRSCDAIGRIHRISPASERASVSIRPGPIGRPKNVWTLGRRTSASTSSTVRPA